VTKARKSTSVVKGAGGLYKPFGQWQCPWRGSFGGGVNRWEGGGSGQVV